MRVIRGNQFVLNQKFILSPNAIHYWSLKQILWSLNQVLLVFEYKWKWTYQFIRIHACHYQYRRIILYLFVHLDWHGTTFFNFSAVKGDAYDYGWRSGSRDYKLWKIYWRTQCSLQLLINWEIFNQAMPLILIPLFLSANR